MIKPVASLALSCSLTALGIGALGLCAAPAQAACIGGDGICTTFTGDSPSTPTGVGGFSGTLSLSGAQVLNRFRVNFKVAGYTGSPFSLTGISVAGDGIIGSPLVVPDVTGIGNGTTVSSFVNLSTSISSLDYTNSTISFAIPSGINTGSSITAELFYASTAETGGIPDNSLTSDSDFTTTAVPGPLPLLGAGAAFGFSRTLRKRIKAADQA